MTVDSASQGGRPILVTGATGNVGAEVVRVLRRLGFAARAGVRALADGAAAASLGAEVVALDFMRSATFAPALAGAGGVFLMRPPAIARMGETLNPFIDAAAAAGVARIAFLSVVGADQNPLIPHYAVEQHLRRSSVAWLFLRASFFAQNLGEAYRQDIRDDDRIYVPSGTGRAAFVDTRDLAEAAARGLTDPAVRLQAWRLTGAEAVSFAEVAATLSEVLGRPIRYVPATALGYARHLRRRGMPLGQLAVQTLLHLGLRLGQAATVDPTLARVLGRPPRSVREYVVDHAALWRHAVS